LDTTITIYELPSSLFDRCQPLYARAWFDLPIYDAVFEGRQPGRIFVDNAEAPSAAIMCGTYDYFIAGTPDTPLRAFIKDAPEEAGVFQHLYSYAPIGEAWTEALMQDTPLIVIPRRNYRWQMGRPAPEIAPPPGSCVKRIDLALAEQADRELPLPFLKMFWGSHEALIKNGFAYCALQGDAVTSVVYAIAMSSSGVVIGIDTIEKFQRQGYGTAASAAFIREALERGLQPVWDTDDENVRSWKLAEKLGFVEHEPFKELRPPDWKLKMTRGVWSRGETRADGVVEWVRGG
jgi:RimJ/RimL family protein N-acetyltransferase